MGERRRLVIVNRIGGGHRLWFVRSISQFADELGLEPRLLTDEGVPSSAEFNTHLSDLGELKTEVAEKSLSWRRLLARARELAGADGGVVLPEADRALLALTTFRWGSDVVPVSALLMRTPECCSFSRAGVRAIAKSAMGEAAGQRGVRLLFLTDAVGSVARRRGYKRAEAVRDPAPDPSTTSREEARRLLGLPANTVVLASVGPQDDRKDPAVLMEAWRQVKPPIPAVLLIAGSFDAAARRRVQALLAVAPGLSERIVLVDRYLSEADFGACVRAADLLLLVTTNDGPSGLFARAAASRTPVITAGNCWTARAVREAKLGVVADLSPGGIQAAMLEVLTRWPVSLPTVSLQLSDGPSFARALIPRELLGSS